jgi:hypothetical protein
MSSPADETQKDGTLTLEIRHGEDVEVRWIGRSIARNPRTFLQPVLSRLFDEALAAGKRLVLDFRDLEYLNSSTITPVVRLLARARDDGGRVLVRYHHHEPWQRLSFSALKVFERADGVVHLDGGEPARE